MAFRTVGPGKDYATIQAAVDASADGDVVVIFPGTYEEVVTLAKFVHLKGARQDELAVPESIRISQPSGTSARGIIIETFATADPGPLIIEDLSVHSVDGSAQALQVGSLAPVKIHANRCFFWADGGSAYSFFTGAAQEVELSNCHLKAGYYQFYGRSTTSTLSACVHSSNDPANTSFYNSGYVDSFDSEHIDVGTTGYGTAYGSELIDASGVYAYAEIARMGAATTFGADPAIESEVSRLAAEPKTALRIARDLREALLRAYLSILRGGDILGLHVHRLSATETRRADVAHLLADAAVQVALEKIAAEVLRSGQTIVAALSRGDLSAALRGNLDRLSGEATCQAIAAALNILIDAHHSAVVGLSRGDLSAALRPLLTRLETGSVAVGRVGDIRAIVADMHPVIGKISAEVTAAVAARLSTIDERDIYTALQHIAAPLSAPPPRMPGADIPAPPVLSPEAVADGQRYALYLDGMPILRRIETLRLSQDEAAVHDELVITSADLSLWADADPAVHRGQPRLELHVGTRVIQFVVDDRELKSEHDFEISALSLGVRNEPRYLDEPWTPPSVSEFPMAKDLAEMMLPHSALVWGLPVNWRVNSDFAMKETPLEALQELAATVGAIVRIDDEGRVVVRRRWPVRPVYLVQERPDVKLDRTWIVDAGVPRIERTQGFDCIEVSGVNTSADTKTPSAEIEEESPVIGQSVHLRVFWEKDAPKDAVDSLVTSGSMGKVGSGTMAVPEPSEDGETDPVVVDFTEGTASVSYPIKSLDSVRWIGRSAGPITFEPYTKELKSAGDWGVAEIRYTTAFSRYLVRPGQVDRLLAVWGYGSEFGEAVRVKVCLESGDASNPADPVEDARIVDETTAVERGTAELDELAYDRIVVGWTAPYRDEMTDGATVEIRNENVHVSGNFRATKVETIFEGPAIWQECEGIQCQL